MDTDEIKYCLSKQLSTAHTLQTIYGSVPLDQEMIEAIEAALRPILENRIKEQEQ